MKILHKNIQVFLLIVLTSLAVICAESQPLTANVNVVDDKQYEKPEARQIGSMLPYAWYQPSSQSSASAPSSSWSSPSSWSSSSGQSLLSMLKPTMAGGRRSSLTSRLRNLMNALFYSGSFLRRETSSPYLPSGSSYSYSFRPPPFGFSSSGFPSSSGLGSSMSQQNLYGSASSYRPVVLPNYQTSSSDLWSNYKQYASNSQSSLPSSYSSSQFAQSLQSPLSWNGANGGTASQNSAIWQNAPQSSGSSYSSLGSTLGSSNYPSYSSGSSPSSYQSLSSNGYPNTSYQRSSSVNQYSPPLTGSVSQSVSSSSSSSSSSSQNGKSNGYQSQ